MKQLHSFFALIILLTGMVGWGQTTLNIGDIAIIGMSTGDEDFAFVTFVDLDAGTEIYFTDEEADGDLTIGTGEGTVLYTAPSGGVTAGTVITGNSAGTATNFSATADGSLALGNSGDGLLAYQGTSVGNVTTFLHHVGEDSGDRGTFPGSTLASSDWLEMGADDGNYTGTTSGSASALFSSVNNVSNWTVSGSASISPPVSFTIATGGPTVGYDAVSSSENETNSTFSVNIPVTLSNYGSSQVDLSVTLSGGSYEVGDVSLTTTVLNFTGNGTQNISIDINSDADADDETVEITIAETSSTGANVSPSLHTLTINDDEIPTVGWQISSADQVFTIDFESSVSGVNEGEFSGTGFASTPSSGQLDSDAWATTGASDGSLAFGGSGTSGDFSRGVTTGGVSSGGVYAFEVSSSNFALGVQSTGSDYAPGSFTLRTQNQTGATLSSAVIAFTVYVYNDQSRSSEIAFSHSTDDSSYTDVSNLTLVTSTTAEGSPSWEAHRRIALVSGLSVSDENFFYFKWAFDDVAGSGSRDEIAIDDIDVIFNPSSTELDPPSGTFLGFINDGADLTIGPNSALTIEGDLVNNGSFVLNASSSGYSQLKVSGSVSGSGSVTVKQYIANAGWHNLAIPVDISSLDDLGDVGDQAGTGAQNTFYWNPSGTPQWVNQTASDADVKGRGYLAYVGTYGIAAAPATLSLTGTPYTSLSPSISYGTGTDQDWNLIANPFTCSLDFNALDVGTSGTNVNNSFAIWDPSADGGNGDYVTVSSISSSSQKIAPLQSFWVQTTGSGPSFPSMSMGTHGTVGSSPTYYKNQSVIADRLFLHTYQASNPQMEDELLIGMVAGASDGNDNAYDAGKRIGNNVAPFLMSAEAGSELAINAIDYGPLSAKPKLLQLRFVSAKNNEDYFIALEDSLLTNEYRIVLEDKKLNKRHDLNSRAYRFTHDVTEEYRFVLHLEPLIEKLDEHTQVVVAAGSGSGGFFIIYFKEGSSAQPMEGVLYDLQGRRVKSFTVPAGQDRVEVSTQDLPTGIYLLKIQTPNGIHAEKILID